MNNLYVIYETNMAKWYAGFKDNTRLWVSNKEQALVYDSYAETKKALFDIGCATLKIESIE